MKRKAVSGIMTLLLTGILMLTLNIQPFGTFNLNVTLIRAEEDGGAVTVGTCPLGGYTHIYRDIITFTSHPEGHLMYYNISAGGELTDTGIPGSDWLAIYEDTIAFLPYAGDVIGFYSISMGAAYYIPHPLGDYFDPRDLVLWAMNFPSRVVSIHSDITAFYDYYGEAGEEEPPVKIWYSIAGGDFIKIAEGSLGYGWGVSVYEDTIAFSQGGVIKYYNTTTAVTTNTGLTGTCPSIYEDIITFQFGSVIMYYNITSGTVKNTGQAGEDSYIHGTCGKHMSIAYSASDIIMTYDVKTGNVTNTGEVGKAPSMGYGGAVVFIVPDTEFWWVKFLPNLTLCRIVPIQVIWEGKVPAGEARALTVDKKTVVWVEVFSTFPFPVKTSIRVIYDFGRQVYHECGPGGVLCAEQLVVNPGRNEFYIPGGPRNPPHPGLAVRPLPPRPLPAINPPPNNPFNTNPVWIDPNTEPPDAGPWLFWTRAGFDGNIRAMVDPWGGPTPIAFPGKILEVNEWDNEAVTGKKFVECKPLRILYLPIRFPADPARGIAADPAFVNIPQMISRANEFLLATYPVADNRFRSGLSWSLQAWVNLLGSVGLVPPPAWLRNQAGAYFLLGRQASRIAQLWGYDRAVILVPRRNALPAGRVGGAWLDTWFGIGTSWGISWLNNVDEVPVFVEDTFWTTVAHELGHTYFLWHPQDVGPLRTWTQRFWVAKRLYEDAFIDGTFMTTGFDAIFQNYYEEWIDKGRFDTDNIPGQLNLLGPGLPRQWNLLDQFMIGLDPEVLLISGLIFKNGTVKADESWYHLPQGTLDIELGTTGNYTVVFLDDQSQVLGQCGFNATFTLINTETFTTTNTDFFPFVFNVPYVNGTSLIEIRNATGYIVASKAISANPPIVNVTFPNGGELLESGVNYTITWDAHDPDGDPLTYSIAHSQDGGQTWIPMALDLTETSYTWNVTDLQPGSNYLIKVIANDGVNTGEDVSDGNFTIAGHDVAITNITPSKTVVGQGYSLSINVTIENQGDFTETFDVTAYANTTIIETREVALASGNSANVTFNWNTSGFAKGNYTIKAYAWPVLGETDTLDNTFPDGMILVTIPGDINGDTYVNAKDAVLLGVAFNSKKGDPSYNPNADINDDDWVNAKDAIILGKNFNEHW